MINVLYLHAGAEMYGADKVLLELVAGLDKEKFRPVVVLPCDGVLVDALKKENIETMVIPYPILRRKYFNLKGILVYIKNYLTYSKKLVKIAKEFQIQAVHINTAAVLEGIYIKRKLKIPLVWHIHEIIVNPRIVYSVTSMLVGKFSNKIVTVSKAVAGHLKKSGKVPADKVEVIYNGVDNHVFNPQNETEYLRKELDIPQEAKVVGMIGRVNAWKGQQDFMKAVVPLLKKHKHMYAMMVGGVFAGEEWRMDELKEAVEHSENSERIRLLEFRADSGNIHNLFDMFVLPSTNPDPLPTVVLEAMACGKPVIGYRHGGVCEMVDDGKTGLLAEVGNAEDLGRKIDMLYSDSAQLAEMGKKAEERQKTMFSLNSYVTNFEKLYETVVKSN